MGKLKRNKLPSTLISFCHPHSWYPSHRSYLVPLLERDSGNPHSCPPLEPARYGRATPQPAWLWNGVKASKTEGREQEELPGGEFIGSESGLFRNDCSNFLSRGWPRVWEDVEMVSVGFCHFVFLRFWERSARDQSASEGGGEGKT